MEHILIPHKRAELLDKKTIERIEERLRCSINIDDNELTITGQPYDEYNAKNVLQAFGRGFELSKAYKLLNEDYFFQLINLKDIFGSKEQMMRIKARIIGTDGRAKGYIESVSGAELSIFGSSVSMMGRADELKVADSAIRILIDGGTHKTAYKVMEKEKRKTGERHA